MGLGFVTLLLLERESLIPKFLFLFKIDGLASAADGRDGGGGLGEGECGGLGAGGSPCDTYTKDRVFAASSPTINVASRRRVWLQKGKRL